MLSQNFSILFVIFTGTSKLNYCFKEIQVYMGLKMPAFSAIFVCFVLARGGQIKLDSGILNIISMHHNWLSKSVNCL